MTQTINTEGLVVTPAVGTIYIVVPVVNDFLNIIMRDDLANVFMNTSEFAEPVLYFHSSLGIDVTYNVIYDDPHDDVALTGPASFSSIKPQFQVTESVLEHRLLKNDRCEVRGKTYLVDEVVSDGVGVTTVFLRYI